MENVPSAQPHTVNGTGKTVVVLAVPAAGAAAPECFKKDGIVVWNDVIDVTMLAMGDLATNIPAHARVNSPRTENNYWCMNKTFGLVKNT